MRTCEGSATPTLATGSGSFDYARRLASLRMTLAYEGSATPTLATRSGSFDYARRLASLRMTLACEGSATPTLATGSGSFDYARRLASLRMTLHSVRGADQVQDSRVSRSGRIATDRKAVQRRGPGRGVLGSKPQLATTVKT